MTILSPKQPWPQVCVKHCNGEFQCYMYRDEDKSVIDLTVRGMNIYTHDHYHKPTIIFAGPRAWHKIQNIFVEERFTFVQDFSERKKREFLGIELILTVDDGLWIA